MRKHQSLNSTNRSLLFAALFLLSFSFAAICQSVNVIPKPQYSKINEHSTQMFSFNEKTRIVCNQKSPYYSVVKYLQSELECLNPALEDVIDKEVWEKEHTQGVIIFTPISDKQLGKEGYEIDIKENEIVLMANEANGFFYACQTLLQLLTEDISPKLKHSKAINQSITVNLLTGSIRDWPRFAYRGKHLDCARHFFTIKEVKEYIDMLAFHKLNTLHWHLTDDQGWRIEIQKYPLLQEKAAWRDETLIGHYSDTFPQKFDGKPYGGYYTQEQIKEIVQYAKYRFIDIIPEIDIPGHSRALLCAYPQYSCTGKQQPTATTWGVFEDVLCTKEETFTLLQNIFDEIIPLFPSQYIHIGGDECPKVRWKTCPVCQVRIKENGLKDEKELQSYFMNRIEKYLESKGKQVIGWDEVLEGGANGNITIMSWQGEAGGVAAARSKHNAIMSPSGYLYFDYYQGPSYQEPLGIGGFTNLKKVYMYEPVPNELNKEEAKYILGPQANTWTEYIESFSKLQYFDMPRMSALAEIAWSDKTKNYEDFLRRLESQLSRYQYMNFNYSTAHYAVQGSTKYNKAKNQVELTLTSVMPESEIHYTINGEKPSKHSPLYTKPLVLSKNSTIRAVAIQKADAKHQLQDSPLYEEHFTLNKATGKTYTIANVNPQYSSQGKYTLTDGLFGTKQSWNSWVGTLGNDYDVTIDLEKITEINSVIVDFLDSKGSWIFAPKTVSVSLSNDGKTFSKPQIIKTSEIKSEKEIYTYKFDFNGKKTKSRYVRLHADAVKMCPEGHSGYGYAAHCFCDEISVE